MGNLADRIASLSPAKLELLAQRLKKRSGEGTEKQEIERRPRDSNAPPRLSYAQQWLWFLDQLEPGSLAYNISTAVCLTGQLNLAALERSLEEVIRRHEILRTTFHVMQGEPRQLIAPAFNLKLPVLDLSNLSETRRELKVHELAAEQGQHAFDLARGPLLRLSLLRLGPEEHVVLLTMHHIISDGWSVSIFIQEMAQLYQGFSQGHAVSLPQLPIQYADFAEWQRGLLEAEASSTQLDYWKQRLTGAPALLELPADKPRPAMQSFRGARQSFALTSALSEGLIDLSRREGVTLFMTLLASFQTLLSRYTGRDDILVGTPVAGRNRIEVERLIGFFANTLVLRTDLAGDPTFRELLGRVREVALGAYSHQDLPFEKLVEKLQPVRNLSHNPLFQVLFALQNTPPRTLDLPGLAWSTLKVDTQTARFDLALELREGPEGITGVCEYSTDLFETTTIARMLEHLQNLLDGIVANPDKRLSALPGLTLEERRQLLSEWNGAGRARPPEQCLHEAFEAQAELRPDAIAVTFEKEHLTYGELDRRANQLARYLRRLGVGPEMHIGISFERGVELVVGLLGILKAGGTYVPLDPTYPKERLSFMLEDAQVPLLLTSEKLLPLLETRQDIRGVCLDSEWGIIAQESTEKLTPGATAENLAYTIYTSGSTGRPKGVQVKHASVVALFAAARPLFDFKDTDTWTAVHSFAFDFSVWEIWGCLLHGGRLVIVSLPSAQSPAAFAKILRDEKVTILNQTPSAIRQLIEVGQEAEAMAGGEQTLRLVICGGEALPREVAARLLEWKVPLWNLYGPTEATVWATAQQAEVVDAARSSVPIGRPLMHTQVYILDQQMQLSPVGAAGELHIGGLGLARGYLNRPEATAERMRPHPFSQEAGARLYKTGDLARYLPGGAIEFLGRMDHQVKVRGFRIELEEIEAVLEQHPDLRACLVTVREDSGNKRLVAYLVAAQETVPTVSELRRFAREKLPEYMIPASLVFLDELPLTPNGKVDRRALPPVDEAASGLAEAYQAPRNATEELLAGKWAQLLNLRRVGASDNFFELGGHSLLATQVVSWVRACFGVELALRSLFETPTVAELAELIEQERNARRGLLAPPLVPRPRAGDLPLSFAQQRLWFFNQLEPDNPVYNIAIAVRLSGHLVTAALEQTFNEIVRRHEVLRTSFAISEGRPVQIIAPSLSLRVPVVDLSTLSESAAETEAQLRMDKEAQLPFDLTKAPLLRVCLWRLKADEHLALLTMHHIASDMWSLGILIEEVSALYEAFVAGRPSPLPKLAVQYADFALWQREWLEGDVMAGHLAYWQEQLAGAPPILRLPTDRPRPSAQSFHGRRSHMKLSPQLSGQLQELAQRENVTMFMLLLAIFQTALSYYTGEQEIIVGTDIANRNHAETEGLIGFFVNQLVLRTKIRDAAAFRELLGEVRQTALEAYAHQDLPFEKLVEAISPGRSLQQRPVFQVKMNVQNIGVRELKLPQLVLSPVRVGHEALDLDLMLVFVEAPEGLSGWIHFNTDLFDNSAITRMAAGIKALLGLVVTRPDISLGELKQILTDLDEQQEALKKRERALARRKKFQSIEAIPVNLLHPEK
jgi:amino acid adenylation domain-containing protein